MIYTGKVGMTRNSSISIKHPTLKKNEQGHLIFYTPSQNKERNTECLYDIETNELWMAGKKEEKHPKFKDIAQFEKWCNIYYATGKDENNRK